MSNSEEVVRARDEVSRLHGPWTAHSINLGQDVWTTCEPDSTWRVARLVRVLRDFGYSNLSGLRILDLACLEGMFAIELARLGAETIGIEGREANVAKARFAKDVLQLERCNFFQDDVRNLTVEKYGSFDIVICAGILYHLDAADALALVRNVSLVCRRMAIFDTHVALETLGANPHNLSKMTAFSAEGVDYRGREYAEHSHDATASSKLSRLWASLDNTTSFWFTRQSLRQALERSGFSSCYDLLHNDAQAAATSDRITFVVTK